MINEDIIVMQAVAQSCINMLNSMFKADNDAITALINHRVPCNDALANHKTCQVTSNKDGNVVGMLGVINGISGVDAHGAGPVAAYVDDTTGKIDGFVVNPDFDFYSAGY